MGKTTRVSLFEATVVLAFKQVNEIANIAINNLEKVEKRKRKTESREMKN